MYILGNVFTNWSYGSKRHLCTGPLCISLICLLLPTFASFPFLYSLESLSLHEMVKAMLLSMFYAAVCVSNHKSAEGREEL